MRSEQKTNCGQDVLYERRISLRLSPKDWLSLPLGRDQGSGKEHGPG